MLQKILQRLILAVLLPVSALGQSLSGYKIAGHIEGLKEGEKVTMLLFKNNAGTKEHIDYDRRDSAYVKNGEFRLSGFVPDGPRLYWMNFENRHGGYKFIRLLIDNNQDITITSSDIEKIPHSILENYVKIEGSPTQDSWNLLIPAFTIYDQSMARLNRYARMIKDSIGFNGPLLDGIFASRDQVNQALYYNIFHDVEPEIKAANLLLVRDIYQRSGHGAILVDIYNDLNEQEKNSFYGRKLKELLPLCIGQPFPEFTLPTPEGTPLVLKDIVTKSKITIVHFWAANSFERKKYQDELRMLYKKYHEKGMNIIGFSSDKYAEEWKDVIKNEQYPWYNVSDLKGKDGLVGKTYHEYGDVDPLIHNTTNVLIDQQGKIMAWDVSESELEWYLWKNLGE